MPQHTGKVVWFNTAKGYGFLKYDGGQDVFCHYSAIQAEGYKSLNPEDDVEFDVVTDNAGKSMAANVIRTKSEASL